MKTFTALSLILSFGAPLALAQAPGDIYAVSSGTRSVVRVDPSTGAQSVAPPGALATSGGFPMGVAAGADGHLFVTLADKVVKISPSGTQSDLATGFGNPGGILIEPGGSLLVADLLTNAISRVDSSTGNVTPVSSGGLISGPLGIGLEPNGSIVVVSRNNASIVRINGTTAAQTFVSQGGLLSSNFTNPQWLAVNSAGDIFVTVNNPTSGIVKVDPGSGAQTLVASGGPLFTPRGIAVNSSGDLVVANGNNRILRVNPNTGAVSEISPNGGAEFINGSAGLAIVPTPPPIIPVATIAAGSNVMWAVQADGTVAQWQSNVGSVPAGLANVIDLGGGNRFALALRADGTVAAWGQDSFNDGMLSIPAGLSGVVAVEGGGSHSLALKSDGTVVAWGRGVEGQTAIPAGLLATAIGAGEYHSLAVRRDGTVAAWGTNSFGQTNVPAGLSGVVAVDAGSWHSLALRVNGTVAAWGSYNPFGQASVPAGLSGVTAIAAGWYHNLALRSDGTVVGWGHNDYGQRTIPAGLNNVVAIAAGAYTSMALRSDGSIVVWGYDPFGSIQPPAGTTFKVPGSTASDTAPPVLSLPAPITVLATGSSGASVSYTATATDDTDPAPVVSCSPASGSTFPIGQTTVGCTATDATGNQSSGSFTVSVTVTSASVTIKGTRLRTSAITSLTFTLSGPGTSLSLSGDATRTLVPGTYQISLPFAEPYGTFTVDSFGQVVAPTGSLTSLATTVDFDLNLLARVTIAVEHLSTDTANASLVLGLGGISNLVRGVSPSFYLPPSLPGSSYLVTTAGGNGSFGTFVVNPNLTLGATMGAVVVTTGPGGPQLDFDLSSLTGIVVPSTADLTVPSGVGAFRYAIAGTATMTSVGGATIYLPANNAATGTYIVSTGGGVGRFGTFRIEGDGSVSTVTSALAVANLGTRMWQLTFDPSKLARVDLRIQSLARPFPSSGVRFSLVNELTWGLDQTVHLPPNSPGWVYQFYPDRASSSSPLFGTLKVEADLTLTTTGAMRIGADGHTLSPDVCALNGLRIAAAPGRTWSLGTAAGYYTRDITTAGNATDLFLPDGSYTVSFSGDGSITATVAGGAITAATPGLSVTGGSVSMASCDSTPPVLSLPVDFSVAATSASGAIVSYTATATDAVDPAPALSCAPASGSLFAIGTTSVACTATDATGNAASGSFNVTVSDQTPPTLTLPANITTPSTSAAGAVVNFSVSATDAIDPAPMVACSAASGATFPIGLTTVSCTATDVAGNVASGSFTVGVTVSSASVTVKGSRLRANGATQLNFRVAGPTTSLNQNGDVTLTLAPGLYVVDAANSAPYGTFTLDSFGQVVSPTGSLTVTGNVVDFNLGMLAGVAIPVTRLTTNFAVGSSVLAIPGITSAISTANGIYYLPPNLPGTSHEVDHRATPGPFGRFRVKADLTLEDVDLTDSLILVNDGTGPGGGGRLDFDLSRLYAFTFPYAMTDFLDPDSAGNLVNVGLSDVAGIKGPVTVYLPPNIGTRTYVLINRDGSGSFGSFVVAPDLTPQQATGSVRFDAANNFYLDFNSLVPVTLKVRELAEPYLPLNLSISQALTVGNELTVHLPPNNGARTYDVNTSFGTNIGKFSITPGLAVQTTGALRLGADGRTIRFDTCGLNALQITPASGRQWRAATASVYAGYSSVATTLFLPNGTYGISFNDGSSISVMLAGGAITGSTPGMSVSGGSISLGSCDNQPPSLTLPAALSIAAASSAGAVVNYAVSATDAVDPAPALTCSPASGSLFPMGTTSVACTATDATGNAASGSFTVTVSDQTPPILVLPGPITVEATGPGGAPVSYQVSAADAIDPAPAISCSPVSGSMFRLGPTTVECSATDNAMNTALGSFPVTVLDRTSPQITMPSDRSVETGDPAGVAVPFTVSAADTVDPSPAVTCTPASGAIFPVGTTAVSCSARDASGNTSTGAFNVNVTLCPIPTLILDPGNALPAYTNQAARTVPASIAGGSCVATVELIVTGASGAQSIPVAFNGDGALSGDVGLSPGGNDVVLKVTDRVGRTFASGARTIVLDQTAPQLQVLSPANDSATGSSALSLSFSVSDSSPVSVSVAGQTFNFTGSSNVQSATVTLAAEGPQTIDLVASDAAGNGSGAQLSVLLDLTAPLSSIDVLDGARFGPLFDDVLPFSLTVDALSATTVTTSYGSTYTLARGGGIINGIVPLTEGVSTVTFAIENEVGRVTSLSRTVTYDKTPPQGDLTSPAASEFTRGTLHLSADVTDALTEVAAVHFQVDALTAQAGVAGTGNTWIASFNSTTVSDGVHSVQATFVDGVGNARSLNRSFLVDNTRPQVSLSAPAAGSYVRGIINITAVGSDATSGVSLLAIAVNGTNVGSCPGSPCSVAFDTGALGADGSLSITATARDLAGNEADPAQISVTADNSAPSNFLVQPASGQVLTTTLLVSVDVVDSAFARVECFVDGVSLGISTDPRFSATVSLLDKPDGALQVACRAEDLAGNATLQSVTPTIRNWSLRMRPNHLNLKSRGKDVRMAVRNLDRAVSNASLLLSRLPSLFLVLPGGVAPVPLTSARPPGDRDDDDDGDSDDDGDDEPRGRVLLKFSRAAFIASIKSGIAIGAIDPKKPVAVTLVSGSHVIGTDTIRVKQ